MGNLKPIKANFENTAGKRAGMKTGKAPHPGPMAYPHNSAFTYAPFAKAGPAVSANGKGGKSK